MREKVSQKSTKAVEETALPLTSSFLPPFLANHLPLARSLLIPCPATTFLSQPPSSSPTPPSPSPPHPPSLTPHPATTFPSRAPSPFLALLPLPLTSSSLATQRSCTSMLLVRCPRSAAFRATYGGQKDNEHQDEEQEFQTM